MAYLTEAEQLEIVRKVLTGDLRRDDFATRPLWSLPTLTYVGVAMTLAGRYRINDDNQVCVPLQKILNEVILMGFEEVEKEYTRDEYEDYQLRESVRRLKLCRRAPQGSRPYQVVLDPSPALQSLIAEHQDSPKIEDFFRDMAEGFARHAGWKMRREMQFLQREQEEKRLRLQGPMTREAHQLVARFKEKYGFDGLAALRAQLDEAQEQQ